MKNSLLSSIERQRFPLSVCDRHTSDWYRTRRVFLLGLILGIGLGMHAAYLFAHGAVP